MTRSRLFSLVVSAMVALAGLGVGTAAASTGSAGSVEVRSAPPLCC
jgi:hypothetical protein